MKLRILVSALIVVLLVSFYVTVIPSLELFSDKKLVKSLALPSHRDPSSVVTFRMGDALKVVAEVDDVSNGYFLTVQDDIGEVFSTSGGIGGSCVEVGVPLCQPSFEAGKSYVLSFHVYAFNYPLLGAVISDKGLVSFAVDSSPTTLDFEASYDGVFRCLSLRANLTNLDGFPVADEAVDFYARQDNGKQRPTDGWIPIGSSETSAGGVAALGLAFNMPCGSCLLRAHHRGNENFGETENITSVEIFCNTTGDGFGFIENTGGSFKSIFSSGDVGNLTLQVSSTTPYALLAMEAEATYIVDTPLHGDYVYVLFFLDYMNETGIIAGYSMHETQGPPYVYEGSLVWWPNVTGYHKLIAGVVNGSIGDIANATRGVGIRASTELDLDFQFSPSNLVLYWPEALCGDSVPITVAVSKPRPYEAVITDFFSVVTLALKFFYNGVEYATDEAAGSVPVNLYVNDTLAFANSTDEDGLAHFALPLNFTSACLKGVIDSPFLDQTFDEKTVFFKKIRVYDKSQEAQNPDFGFNFTLGNGADSIFVGAKGQLKAEVSLLNQSLYIIPVSILYAKLVSSFETDASGEAVIPSGSNYLRVHNTTLLEYDLNHDCKVDIKDVAIVAAAYGSFPGYPNWNVDADINHDNRVDIKDVASVAQHYGEIGDHVVFNDGQEVCLDSKGFAVIPDDTTALTVYISGGPGEASIEFLRKVSNETSCTNSIGRIESDWVPSEVGLHLVQVKLPDVFDVSVTSETSITGLDASTNLVEYFEVEKRSIELSVDYVPDDPTLDDNVTMIASCFDLSLGEPAEELYVDFFIQGLTVPDAEEVLIYIGWALTNSSGVATFSFVPRDYYEDFSLFPWFYVIAACFETGCTLASEASVIMDTRYPTRLEFLGDEVIHAPVGKVLNLGCRLVRADNGEPVVDRPIQIYVNDTWQGIVFTDEDGVCALDVIFYEGGLYFFRAVFSWGEGYYDVLYRDFSEVTFVIVAEVVPVFVHFEVQPEEFKPGTTLTLTATVWNATSNDPLQGFVVWFYWCDEDGVVGVVGSDVTDTQGVASVTWTYPEDGVYVFWALVSAAQQIMSSPVMLTVGKETELSINVEQGEGFEHTFSGRLLCGGAGVAGKWVVVKVNGTAVDVVETSGDGSYSSTLNLEPVDDEPTNYQIEVVFYGDDALNLTGLATLPNGTEYAFCTTFQYFGYKPSSNTAMLTVEPASTQITASSSITETEDGVEIAPPKTPEEMEQEAKDEGSLRVEPRFSWWYPWFRLHFIYAHGGQDQLDAGISLFGADELVIYNPFKSWINEYISDIVQSVFIAWLIGEAVVLTGTWGDIWTFLLALGISLGIKGVLLSNSWDSVQKLRSAFVATFISTIISVGTLIAKFLPSSLIAMANNAVGVLKAAFNFLYKFIIIPINIYLLFVIHDRLVQLGSV